VEADDYALGAEAVHVFAAVPFVRLSHRPALTGDGTKLPN